MDQFFLIDSGPSFSPHFGSHSSDQPGPFLERARGRGGSRGGRGGAYVPMLVGIHCLDGLLLSHKILPNPLQVVRQEQVAVLKPGEVI